MSTLQKSMMKRFQTPPIPPGRIRSGLHSRGGGLTCRDYTPVHWSKYFQTKDILEIGEGSKFCVYRSSNTDDVTAPTVFFIHGGGFSALTWSVVIELLMNRIECHALAVDLRGHGETTTLADYELGTRNMVEDLIKVIKRVNLNQTPIVLVGHSLGGALAVHLAAETTFLDEIQVVALIVIDVVEGSALESLGTMNSVLRNRPTTFPSTARAIQWCVRSGQIRNIESARVSMPGQLKHILTDQPASLSVSITKNAESAPNQSTDVLNCEDSSNSLSFSARDVIVEEGSEMGEQQTPASTVPMDPASEPLGSLTWRIDLSRTAPYWNDWFEGLSSKFLSVTCPKLLLLAGVDRLDRDLTVGQMQGKFQMQVLPNVGHAVHEDSPLEVAHSMAAFLVRHKLVKGKVEMLPTFPGC